MVEAFFELAGEDGHLTGWVRFAEGDIERSPHHRERRPQLVRGIGHKAALRLECALEPGEHAVEGVAELAGVAGGFEGLPEAHGGRPRPPPRGKVIAFIRRAC